MAALFLAPAVTPTSAEAVIDVDRLGAVRAAVAYSPSGHLVHDLGLVVLRNGYTAYDAAITTKACPSPTCRPVGPPNRPPLTVADLDGDAEAELLLNLVSGGNHCCFVTQIYAFDGSGTYQLSAERTWGGDTGTPVVADLDGDRIPELRTVDGRFSCRFSSCVASALPLAVWRYRTGGMRDITQRFREEVRLDAEKWWAQYIETRGTQGTATAGYLAAWAADNYRLGQRRQTLRALRREERSGRFQPPTRPNGKTFIPLLDEQLRAWGYDHG